MNDDLIVTINGTEFKIDKRVFVSLLLSAVPPYMRDSKTPAPDDASDLIRGAIKSTFALIGNKILFNIYGAQAPKIPRRADKLPYLWGAMTDWVVGLLAHRLVNINATEDGENSYRIIGFSTQPLAATLTAQADCGCDPAPTSTATH